MLVLSGYSGEKFIIDEDLIVQIIKVKGKSVMLGFIVPDYISVDREKIHNLKKKEREKQKNSKAKNDDNILNVA